MNTSRENLLISCLLIFAVTLCLFSAVGAPVEEPPDAGVYAKFSGQWKSLERIHTAGGSQRLAKVIVHKQPTRVVRIFHNSHASIKIVGSSVQLFVRDVPNFGERDVLIVKLDVKKGHRELQTVSAGDPSTFKSAFSKRRAPRLGIYKISDHTYSMVPVERLDPGEYMVTVSPGTIGYDFSVE